MPNRSKGRGQTKSDPWSSKLGVGHGVNYPILEKKPKNKNYKNKARPLMRTLIEGDAPQMGGSIKGCKGPRKVAQSCCSLMPHREKKKKRVT